MEEHDIKNDDKPTHISNISNRSVTSTDIIVPESKLNNSQIEKPKEQSNEHSQIDKKNESFETNDSSVKDFTLEDIFINLTLIARIEVGNKLVRNDKYVNIDTSYFQFITRWFNSQNRTDSIRFTASVLSKAFEYSDNLSKQKDDESRQNLLRLNTALSNAINGLTNLSQTYHYDKLTQSEIDVMINNIRTKLNIQSKHIQFVDEKYSNKDEYKVQSEKDDKHKHENKRDIMIEIKNSVMDNIKRDKKDDKKEHKEYRERDRERDRDRDRDREQYDTRDKDSKDNRDYNKDHKEDHSLHHSHYNNSHLKKKSL